MSTHSTPGPVRAFAEHEPLTSIVDTVRGLFGGTSIDDDICLTLAWCVGTHIVNYVLAMATYRRKFS